MRRAGLLALIAAVGGCAPTETGNPSGEEGVVVLGLTAHTTDPAAVALGASEGGLGVTSVRLLIESVSVMPCDPAEGERRVDVDSVVDLAVGGRVEIPSGDACAISVAIADGGDAGAPAFAVEGARADGVSVRLVYVGNATVSVAPPSGALALSEGLAPFLSIDLAVWLGGLGIDSITPDPTGGLVIDATTHPSVVDDAGAVLATSATLHFDADGDGTLSAEELHDVAAGHP